MKNIILSMLLICLFSSPVFANTIFFEDFEDNLSRWVGKDGGAHNGVIATDPIEGDRALTFTALNYGGDIFTNQTFFADSYILSFDYLGTCSTGDCGGFIGYSYNLNPKYDIAVYPLGDSEWLGGTGGISIYPDLLPDTGVWEHVTINFSTIQSVGAYLMLEDFVTSNPYYGDVFFDNILLTDSAGATTVPEPSTLFLFGSGLVGLVYVRNRFSN